MTTWLLLYDAGRRRDSEGPRRLCHDKAPGSVDEAASHLRSTYINFLPLCSFPFLFFAILFLSSSVSSPLTIVIELGPLTSI